MTICSDCGDGVSESEVEHISDADVETEPYFVFDGSGGKLFFCSDCTIR